MFKKTFSDMFVGESFCKPVQTDYCTEQNCGQTYKQYLWLAYNRYD